LPPITGAVHPAIGMIPAGVEKHVPPVAAAAAVAVSRTTWPGPGNVRSHGFEVVPHTGDAICVKFVSMTDEVVGGGGSGGSGDALVVVDIAGDAVASIHDIERNKTHLCGLHAHLQIFENVMVDMNALQNILHFNSSNNRDQLFLSLNSLHTRRPVFIINFVCSD
jgi:hypothetical protein